MGGRVGGGGGGRGGRRLGSILHFGMHFKNKNIDALHYIIILDVFAVVCCSHDGREQQS